jgi:hypothetical protein
MTWKIEMYSHSRRWRQIGFPETEVEAVELFDRAVCDYPSDIPIRLRDETGALRKMAIGTAGTHKGGTK